MNLRRAARLLELCMKARVPALLVGHSGVGKTQIIAEFAEKLFPEHNYMKIAASQQDPGDFVGLPYKKDIEVVKSDKKKNIETVTMWARPGWMKFDPMVVFFDEVNQCHQDVESALFSLVDEKHIHTHSLHEDSVIVAAMNPPISKYSTAKPLSDAFLKRFVVIPFTPEPKEFLDWAKNSGGRIDKSLLKLMQMHEDVTGLNESLDLTFTVTPSPRQVERASKLLSVLKKDSPKSMEDIDFLSDIVKSTLGTEAAAKYIAFQKSQVKPLEFQDILKSWGEKKEVFESFFDIGRNDLISATISNFFDGFVGIPTKFAGSVKFDVPSITIDDTDKKIRDKAYKQTKTIISKSFNDIEINNIMAFLKIVPSDLFYGLVYKILKHPPFDKDKSPEHNEILINFHFVLVTFFFGEAFAETNLYHRIEKESADIYRFVKATGTQE